MADPNPMAVIADCIAEVLGVLQTDNIEKDAFNMLGSAIVDAVADDPAHTEALRGLVGVGGAAEGAIVFGIRGGRNG
jgi:hypothetical protein